MSKEIVLRGANIITGVMESPNSSISLRDGMVEDIFYDCRFEQKPIAPDAEVIQLDADDYVVPGLLDTHIHGYGGYGTDLMQRDAILEMSKGLAKRGVVGFFPTLYTEVPELMFKSIDAIVEAAGHEEGAKIMGIHLEGPFVSPKRSGAQNPEGISPVNLELMQAFVDHGKGLFRSMTVAPELKGMRELAIFAAKHNITLQAGHSNAEYRHIQEGVQAGILHTTHLFNAMSPLGHRDPGAAGGILMYPQMAAELIADGRHVHKDLVKMVLRNKPIHKVVLVTDSLTPTEQEGGELIAGGFPVEYKNGLFYHTTGSRPIAGSSLTMIQGIKNLVEWGVPMSDAIAMATSSPASVHRLYKSGSLISGYRGDVTVLDKNLEVKMTIVGGKIVFRQGV